MKPNTCRRSLVLSICAAVLAVIGVETGFALPGADPSKVENLNRTLSPYFIVLGDGSASEGESETLPLKKTEAKVHISGVIADVELRQVYRNTGDQVLEAIYVFPGSTRSAVHGLTMEIGERRIEARIAEKEAAKQEYEEAKAAGQTAALLEQERPNVFRMSVGHILPGDDVVVTLRYTELLVPTDRVYEFVFPTVVGPRYSNRSLGEGVAAGDGWVANPYLEPGVEKQAAPLFGIEVDLAAGMPLKEVTCATHPVRIDYEGKERARVALDGSEERGGNRDFVLRYRLAGNRIETGLLLHEDKERSESFFLLTVQPPKRVTPAVIPGREYVFVVDVSGSMSGFPLDTAKSLMRDLFRDLRPTDRFNVMVFAGGTQWMARGSLEASQRNLDRAIAFLDGQRGGGGTELGKALEGAFDLPADGGISRNVIVVTDGMVDFEREVFQIVRERLGDGNLFAFGIGSSVNRFLIEGLARAGQGEPFVVLDPSEARGVADRLKEMIAAPVLTDVRIDFGEDFDVYDIEPKAYSDVFADRPLVVRGKFRGEPGGSVTVSGVSGSERLNLEVPVDAEAEPENPALPYLWARERIAALSDDFELTQADEAKTEVTNLGLTYHLLTRFTSFIAVDNEVRPAAPEAKKQTTKQPLPLPQGMPVTAVGGGTSPEPLTILLWLTGMGSFFWRRLRGRDREG
ncbi:MAG: VWA domain-containing protein [Verrucomicrobiae bacterium]|nr:VWA domain-containing protein [Verrucomicrobiae bacterium]